MRRPRIATPSRFNDSLPSRAAGGRVCPRSGGFAEQFRIFALAAISGKRGHRAIRKRSHAPVGPGALTINQPEYASRLGAVCNNLGLAFESEHRDEHAHGDFGEAIDWHRKALALSPGWPQAQAYLDTHTANLQRINDVDKQADAAGESKGPDARAGNASRTSLEAMRHIAEMTNETSRSAAAQLLPRASSSTAYPRSSE